MTTKTLITYTMAGGPLDGSTITLPWDSAPDILIDYPVSPHKEGRDLCYAILEMIGLERPCPNAVIRGGGRLVAKYSHVFARPGFTLEFQGWTVRRRKPR